MVMNFMQKIYFGMLFRITNWTAQWEEDVAPEEELRQMLDEVKNHVASIKSTVEEQTAIIESDFNSQTNDKANGLARQRRDV